METLSVISSLTPKLVVLRPLKLSSGVSWPVNSMVITFAVTALLAVAMTVLKSFPLDEVVLKVTEVVWPVPEAPDEPLHTGFPLDQERASGK